MGYAPWPLLYFFTPLPSFHPEQGCLQSLLAGDPEFLENLRKKPKTVDTICESILSASLEKETSNMQFQGTFSPRYGIFSKESLNGSSLSQPVNLLDLAPGIYLDGP